MAKSYCIWTECTTSPQLIQCKRAQTVLIDTNSFYLHKDILNNTSLNKFHHCITAHAQDCWRSGTTGFWPKYLALPFSCLLGLLQLKKVQTEKSPNDRGCLFHLLREIWSFIPQLLSDRANNTGLDGQLVWPTMLTSQDCVGQAHHDFKRLLEAFQNF